MTPLLKRLEIYIDYPFDRLDQSIVKYITCELAKRPGKGISADGSILLRMFECFLQITNRKLISLSDFRNQLPNLDLEFEGAIWSPQFVSFESSRRLRYSRVWRHVKSIVKYENQIPLQPLSQTSRPSPIARKEAAMKFESLDKNAEALWYWSGWQVTNLTGKNSYLPLARVYKALGYNFSKSFYHLYSSIVSNQRAVGVPGTTELLEFLASNSTTFNSASLKAPKTTKKFWIDFRSYFFQKRYASGNGSKLSTLSDVWLYSIEPLAKKMVSSGLLAAPHGGMPKGTPTFNGSHSPNHRVNKNGFEENIKLTFPIPLHVTDEQAIEIIFGHVRRDLDLVKSWAQSKIDRVSKQLHRLTQNLQEHRGSEPPLQIDASEEKYFSVYNQMGFATNKDVNLSHIYNAPLTKVATILPLPTSSAVIPFAYFLIAHHSEITPEFLMSCKLYNQHGMISGLEQTDAGWYLVGYKYRKGAQLAEQKILLNDDSYRAVKTLIALTDPARLYLKKKNDPAYRLLFLRTGKGFGFPKRVKGLSLTPTLRKGMITDFNSLGASNDHAETLSDNCTLTSVRALGGVAKYIETESLAQASKALGHTRFDFKLLKRYIPKPLLTFFSERWIRVFHQGFILEAMSESPYALAATDFNSEEEVLQFLSKNSLKIRKKSEAEVHSRTAQPNREVVFCVDEVVLTAMLKISSALQSSTATAKQRYWAGISKHLIEYIDSDECSRPDFQDMLKTARKMVA
ncbi:hypothetical protein [Pseudomonas qingdaonensis]|uniref:hypothetical protein n=1 Tax=Pseudomonas qingdaonensis TaxID=2056231 RepID=UPI002E179DF3|nr:hypothetical protein [Pseudomonas qingdaonensis]